MNSFKIARRNIWRNKRRTLITVASVFFAVFFAVVMRSLQLGSYAVMIKNVVSSYTGHIQIHKTGYWDDKIINNTFPEDPELEKKVSEIQSVDKIVPRLESFALASFDEQTKGSIVIGIKPEEENQMTKLANKIAAGTYLSEDDKGVLVSEKLASFLKLSVKDTLVLMGQGYHAATAAGKYPVRGIIHLNSPELNNKMIYINLPEAQELYSAPEMLSSLSILLKNSDDINAAEKAISEKIDLNKFEVMSWKKITPELNQAIQSDNISGEFMLAILYMIVGFGVFGTIVMMTAERKKEFGVIVAVGMEKIKLVGMLFYETLLLGLVGIISGFLVALPIIFYYSTRPIHITGAASKTFESFGFDPVMAFSTHLHFMISQIIVVFVIVLIAFLYPLIHIFKLDPVKSMRN
ncbi:MAG: ABC transporter permease [Bacteroidales bacterium]|nr:ABC transporter permease [Bacteroidales bacterium]